MKGCFDYFQKEFTLTELNKYTQKCDCLFANEELEAV